ncbi:MAG: tRNA (guanosine(46)-N7)-methyltransferase TrmB [Hyphomonas sp.]|nr:tRNA (guanosine(46)-N7)-methyltransferase TrmB [Hyphomonas sp.]
MAESKSPYSGGPLKTFGRRGGRPLSGRQRVLMDEVLPKLRVPIAEGSSLDPRTLFEDASEIWLEIGFGGGEHVSGQAEANPSVGILASEVFFEGIAKLLGQVADSKLENVRIWPEDAREMVDGLAENSIDRAFILFPDPWPKARHQKRRIIQPDFLDALARVMKPGARVRFATDVRSYADEALERFLAHPAYTWAARSAGDWRIAPSDHIETRYQMKRLGDIEPVYYDFTVSHQS